MIALMCREWSANLSNRLDFPILIFRFLMIVFLLFASLVMLIHSQPFDDGGLSALLKPTDCLAPCLIGIQPGITTAAEARDLLENQQLVASWIEPLSDSNQPPDDPSLALLRWRWSNQRPLMLTGTDASLLYDKKSGLVVTFGSMNTRIPLAILLIELGQPTVGYMSGGINDRDRPTFTYAAAYPDLHFDVVSYIQCPMTLHQLWEAPVTIQIANIIGENSRFTMYPTRLQPLLGAAASYFCE